VLSQHFFDCPVRDDQRRLNRPAEDDLTQHCAVNFARPFALAALTREPALGKWGVEKRAPLGLPAATPRNSAK
jgi:hypothetical protein